MLVRMPVSNRVRLTGRAGSQNFARDIRGVWGLDRMTTFHPRLLPEHGVL